jgi:hypothetical protein
MQTDFMLNALEQAVWARGMCLFNIVSCSQHLSIRYTERLGQYINSVMLNDLYKIKEGSWIALEKIIKTTLAWVDWFSKKHTLSSADDVPSKEFDGHYYKHAKSDSNKNHFRIFNLLNH